jgi:hypothetical protein
MSCMCEVLLNVMYVYVQEDGKGKNKNNKNVNNPTSVVVAIYTIASALAPGGKMWSKTGWKTRVNCLNFDWGRGDRPSDAGGG